MIFRVRSRQVVVTLVMSDADVDDLIYRNAIESKEPLISLRERVQGVNPVLGYPMGARNLSERRKLIRVCLSY